MRQISCNHWYTSDSIIIITIIQHSLENNNNHEESCHSVPLSDDVQFSSWFMIDGVRHEQFEYRAFTQDGFELCKDISNGRKI